MKRWWIVLFLTGLATLSVLADGKKTPKLITDREEPPALDLQALVDQAKDGETLVIPAGRHLIKTGLSIRGKKNFTLRGDRNAFIHLDDVMQDVLSVAESEGVRVENLSLSHLKPLKDYQCHGAVLRVTDCSRVVVEKCELNGCGAVGVFASGVNDLTVRSCRIHHNTFNAFYLDQCQKIVIQGNLVEDNANFMNLHRCDDLEMSDNLTRNNGGYWRPSIAPPGSANRRKQ